LTAGRIAELARTCGFEVAGVASALPCADYPRYADWAAGGLAGGMGYLTDHRAGLREDPRHLLPSARSAVVVGKCYNTPLPLSSAAPDPARGWVSRYAWGSDYHAAVRTGLEELERHLRADVGPALQARICVDTAPLLERSYGRLAGLGWIGRNTCLVNQHWGSWLFLGVLLVSLEIEPSAPLPARCGSCRRCVEACPTGALVPHGDGYRVDARRCLSYLTIEHHGSIEPEFAARAGRHIFGCDVCQEVCPWNRKAPCTADPAFTPRHDSPRLEELAALTPSAFRARFEGSAILRARPAAFLRNVAIAMGNSGNVRFRPALTALAGAPNPILAGAAGWALKRLP
jgi:epoxyqueuosine reductase